MQTLVATVGALGIDVVALLVHRLRLARSVAANGNICVTIWLLLHYPHRRRNGSLAHHDVTAASDHPFAGTSWNAPAVDRSSADQPKSPATVEFDGYQEVGAALAEVKNTERLECSESACTSTPELNRFQQHAQGLALSFHLGAGSGAVAGIT